MGITNITQEIIIPGNLSKLKFTYKEETRAILALYAPNTTNLQFFHTLFQAEHDHSSEHVLFAGDWNVSLSQTLDTSGYLHQNNVQNRDFIKSKMTELQLNDIWRDRNPHATNFTFMKKQARNTTKARLDFFLASPPTTSYIQAVRIESFSSLSDHRPISCTIVKNKSESGPGYWRFDNRLLESPEMLFGMTHRIRRTIRDHLVNELPHDANDQQLSEADSTLSPKELMDMVLLDARAYAIKFVATRKKIENEQKQEMKDRLEEAARILEEDDGNNQEYTNELLDNVNTLKHTIQAKNEFEEEEKARKYMAQRNLEAETPTKAFCNQVNKNKKRTKLTCILQERKPTPQEEKNNPTQKQFEEIFCQVKIKDKVRDFYANLYNHRPTSPDKDEIIRYVGKENLKTLTPDELAQTEKEISMYEIETCLKKTKNNIAPGSSGFTGAFYKAFWLPLKTIVYRAINAIYDNNMLPESLRFGIVNIIPKGSKDQRHLANWRPLTLLNTLYKLISSILAERLKKVLDRLLGPHQTKPNQ